MYARQTTSEETYTLKEARKIIEMEHAQKREVFISKAKQKLLGIIAIGISIIIPFIMDGDATVSLFMLPMGLYALFTKENIIY